MMHFDVIHPESRNESSRQFHDPFGQTPIDELEEIPTGELREISAGNSGSA